MAAILTPPAIIHQLPLVRVRYGLQVSGEPSARVEYSELLLPRDYRDATLQEMMSYLPIDVRQMPPWALLGMLPGMGAARLGSSGLTTITFLTATSATDQTWSVLADWNNVNNTAKVVSSGANGTGANNPGGGGGGYAASTNITLTASGSAKYRLRAGNAGSGVANACWFGNAVTTSLATSLAGIQCAGGQTGGVTTSAIGAVKFAGGNGGNKGSDIGSGCCLVLGGPGGGGGAAGPNGAGGSGGVGGNAQVGVPGGAGSGGAADGGTVSAATSGTEFDATHGCGGGGGGSTDNAALYGGGAGGGINNGRQGLIVVQNN